MATKNLRRTLLAALLITLYLFECKSQSTASPNNPPTIDPQSSPVTVGENEESQRSLCVLTVSDADNDTVHCQLFDINPNSVAFAIWRANTDYEVYVLDNPSLDYSAIQSYTLTIQCSDGVDNATADVIVDIIPNAPPTFINLPTITLIIDASTTILGTVIFTAQAYDNDSSSLTYTMSSTPAAPDLFLIDQVVGEVRTTKDLAYAVDGGYLLEITVSDGYASTTESLVVDLTNVNNVPMINNLPDDLIFDETTAANTLLYSLDMYDADGDSMNITYTVLPIKHTTKFTLTNTNQIRLTSDVWNYEEQSYFVLEFAVSDGYAETTGYFLTITVNDVNEPCVFSEQYYYITMSEGNSGTGLADPGLSATDEDVGDTFTYSINQTYSVQSSYFSIDPNTGEITFALNYDVDTAHPSNVDLQVLCTDSNGDSGTTSVNVTILDVNDNVPTFSQVGFLSYISQLDGPATTVRLMNMYNTDLDSGENGKVGYTWTAVTSGSTDYFHMTGRGWILLTVFPWQYMQYGDVHRFIVTATDEGTPPLSSTAILDIMYRYENTTVTVPTTTSQTTTSGVTFWDEPSNIAWFCLALVLGLLLLALLAYLVHNYCIKKAYWKKLKCCKSQKKIQPKPEPGKTKFDFWNRNNDMREASSYGDSKIGGVTRYDNGLPPPSIL